MNFAIASILFTVLRLPTLGVTTANNSLTSLINGTNAVRLPLVCLAFAEIYSPQIHPQVILLAIIENMQPVCRYFGNQFPVIRTFDYASIQIVLQNRYAPGISPMTYNDACTVLRGLAEFMILNDEFHAWSFSVFVAGALAGNGRMIQGLPGASASGVATS
ncbi:hypothetical protein ABVK25_010383 [Lepraria finkii]|uniref:Uncharacterized protein n=1 Tax=Lepraria finkii TaxID=1340010 RepID=A0ABR4B0V1_9LECA